MIKIQTGLLHYIEDGCVRLLQCEEFVVVAWQTNGLFLVKVGKTGTSRLELNSLWFSLKQMIEFHSDI